MVTCHLSLVTGHLSLLIKFFKIRWKNLTGSKVTSPVIRHFLANDE
jgi:hypothetical protein